MRFRIAAAVAVGLALLAPAAARAEPPLDMAGAHVLDLTGSLGGREPDVEAAIDRLYERTGYDLYVIVVDGFSGYDRYDWANETAELTGLQARDVLLAIDSFSDSYAVSVDSSFPLSDAELDSAAGRSLDLELPAGDYAAAATAYAQELGDALAAVEESSGGSGGGTADGGDSGIPVLLIVLIVIAVGIAGLAAWGVIRLVRRGRQSDSGSPAGPPSVEELDRTADALLIALDDAIRESEQELGFAEAQFGADAVTAFTTALDDAKGKLRRAFAIRQQLDDAQPETAEQKHALTAELIQLCEQADAALDAQADAFDELRSLEESAPHVLDSVKAAHARLGPRVEAAETALAALRSKHGDAAVAAVAENPEQAARLGAFAAESIGTAEAALTAGNASKAAIAVRDAQQAVDQAGRLLGAVDALKAELPKLVERVAAARGALTAAVAEARTAAGREGADAPALSAAAGEAERLLAATGEADPASALAALEAATTALDSALGAARDEQARFAAARQQYERVRATAVERISQAQNYIATRRGGIGSAARTRIAEAERLLAEAAALAADDPASAAQSARRAADYADAALQLARSDVAGFDRGGYGAGGGIDLGSVILGGLLGRRSARSYPGGYGSGSPAGLRSPGGFGGISRRSTSGPSWTGSGSTARRRAGGGGALRSSGGTTRRGGGMTRRRR